MKGVHANTNPQQLIDMYRSYLCAAMAGNYNFPDKEARRAIQAELDFQAEVVQAINGARIREAVADAIRLMKGNRPESGSVDSPYLALSWTECEVQVDVDVFDRTGVVEAEMSMSKEICLATYSGVVLDAIREAARTEQAEFVPFDPIIGPDQDTFRFYLPAWTVQAPTATEVI